MVDISTIIEASACITSAVLMGALGWEHKPTAVEASSLSQTAQDAAPFAVLKVSPKSKPERKQA